VRVCGCERERLAAGGVAIWHLASCQICATVHRSPQCLLHPCPTCSKSRVLAAFANKQKGAKKEPWEASAFQVESEDKKLLDPASGQWSSAAMPT